MFDIIAETDTFRLLLVPDEDAQDPRADWGAEEDAPEVQAWRDGDVWVYVIEEEREWACTTEGRHHDRMTTWETVESCGGFYGRTWAEESAREAFDACVLTY